MKPILSGQITKRVQEELANYLTSEKFRPGDRLPTWVLRSRKDWGEPHVRARRARALEALAVLRLGTARESMWPTACRRCVHFCPARQQDAR